MAESTKEEGTPSQPWAAHYLCLKKLPVMLIGYSEWRSRIDGSHAIWGLAVLGHSKYHRIIISAREYSHCGRAFSQDARFGYRPAGNASVMNSASCAEIKDDPLTGLC